MKKTALLLALSLSASVAFASANSFAQKHTLNISVSTLSGNTSLNVIPMPDQVGVNVTLAGLKTLPIPVKVTTTPTKLVAETKVNVTDGMPAYFNFGDAHAYNCQVVLSYDANGKNQWTIEKHHNHCSSVTLTQNQLNVVVSKNPV